MPLLVLLQPTKEKKLELHEPVIPYSRDEDDGNVTIGVNPRFSWIELEAFRNMKVLTQIKEAHQSIRKLEQFLQTGNISVDFDENTY